MLEIKLVEHPEAYMHKQKIYDDTDEKHTISHGLEVFKFKFLGNVHGPLRVKVQRLHDLMMHSQPEKTLYLDFMTIS
jgi:hypothetical protein